MNSPITWVRVKDGAGRQLDVAQFPITIDQYASFLAADGYNHREWWDDAGWKWRQETDTTEPSYWGEPGYCEDGMLPVTGICLWEAAAFARFCGSRLPMEWEWKWFAGNTVGDRFPWDGDEMDAGRSQLTFFGYLEPGRLARVDAHPSGISKLGVWDLLGNVCEWCMPDNDDTLGTSCMAVLRGGASWHTAVNVSTDFRDVVRATERDNNTGIRLVRGEPLRPVPIYSAPDRKPAATRIEIPARRQNIPRPTAPFRQEGLPTQPSLTAWKLEIAGEVLAPAIFSLADLQRGFPVMEESGFLVCVCKWATPCSVRGVRVKDLLAPLLPDSGDELHLEFQSLPGEKGKCYHTSVPLRKATEDELMVIWEMDGAVLSTELGSPLRSFNFHTYGYKHVKALSRIIVTRTPTLGWWETDKGYCPRGLIQPGTYTLVGNPARKLIVERPGRIQLPDSG